MNGHVNQLAAVLGDTSLKKPNLSERPADS